jgi:hypothetical protein
VHYNGRRKLPTCMRNGQNELYDENRTLTNTKITAETPKGERARI